MSSKESVEEIRDRLWNNVIVDNPTLLAGDDPQAWLEKKLSVVEQILSGKRITEIFLTQSIIFKTIVIVACGMDLIKGIKKKVANHCRSHNKEFKVIENFERYKGAKFLNLMIMRFSRLFFPVWRKIQEECIGLEIELPGRMYIESVFIPDRLIPNDIMSACFKVFEEVVIRDHLEDRCKTIIEKFYKRDFHSDFIQLEGPTAAHVLLKLIISILPDRLMNIFSGNRLRELFLLCCVGIKNWDIFDKGVVDANFEVMSVNLRIIRKHLCNFKFNRNNRDMRILSLSNFYQRPDNTKPVPFECVTLTRTFVAYPSADEQFDEFCSNLSSVFDNMRLKNPWLYSLWKMVDKYFHKYALEERKKRMSFSSPKYLNNVLLYCPFAVNVWSKKTHYRFSSKFRWFVMFVIWCFRVDGEKKFNKIPNELVLYEIMPFVNYLDFV